jgi:RNA polymerase sigma-70 factor (ECF subfamily)
VTIDFDFEEHRSHLRGVAYRMLGSLGEADDAVQEAWIRFDRAAPGEHPNPRGWLTTTVARICLDMLRTRTSRREDSLDAGGADAPARPDAQQELVLADEVGLALLVVLDKLEPAERIAFVLHDLCEVPFDEIAPIVSRTPDATRQLASRARRRVQGSPPPEADLASQRHVVASFITALRNADLAGLLAILDPEIVLRAHVAGKVSELRGAPVVARNWTEGAAAFARFADLFTIAVVDGSLGLVLAPKGRLVRALRFTFEGGRIARADIIGDRARLDALDVVPLASATSEPAG